jgi:hypothetical protein
MGKLPGINHLDASEPLRKPAFASPAKASKSS